MKAIIFERNNQRLEIDFDEEGFKFGLCKVTAYDGARKIVVMDDYTDYVLDTLFISLASPKILPNSLLGNLSLLFDKYCFDLWHDGSFKGQDLTQPFAIFPALYFYQIENGFEFEVGNISDQAGNPESSYTDWQNWLKDNFYYFRINLVAQDIMLIKEQLIILLDKSKYPT